MSVLSSLVESFFFAGVDVSLKTLDLCLLDAAGKLLLRRVFDNTRAGVRQLVALLKRQPHVVRVCLEPTSRYHELLAQKLYASERCIALLPNPRCVHDFAEAISRRAKTDRADAETLATMACCLPLEPWAPPAEELSALNEIATRITQLTRNRTQEKNRLKLYLLCSTPQPVLRDLRSHIALLKRRGEALEQHALLLIDANPNLAKRYRHLLSVPGIGQTSGIQLLAFLSMLPARLNKCQWVACAGLDPRPKDSGQSRKPRQISRRGSYKLRAALYMPALVASRFNPPLRAYYERQTAQGKKPLVALSALMAKLLHIIWAMWHNDQDYDPTRPGPKES
jgi:transposase